MPVTKEESGVLMVMNLPDSLTDDHVRELLSPFGELKRFNLLKVTKHMHTYTHKHCLEIDPPSRRRNLTYFAFHCMHW